MVAIQWSGASLTSPTLPSVQWAAASMTGTAPTVPSIQWSATTMTGTAAVTLNALTDKTVDSLEPVSYTITTAPTSPTPDSLVVRRVSGPAVALNLAGSVLTFVAPAGMPPTAATLVIGVAGVVGGVQGPERLVNVSIRPCLTWLKPAGSSTWSGARMVHVSGPAFP